MITNRPDKPRGLTGNAVRTWGYLFLLMGIAGQSIIQNQILDLGATSTGDLLAAWDSNPGIMPLVTMALVCQAFQTCAAPIFTFLLVEGFLHTKNVKNYLIRVLAVALVSEIPYNLAMGGKWLDLSSRNPVLGLALCLFMLILYSNYQEPGWKNFAIKALITLAAIVWPKILGIQDGACLVLLTATFWGFRNKPNFRNLAAMSAACLCTLFSMFYLAAPLSVMALHMYNGEAGPQNRALNYAMYPVALLCFGIVSMLV